MTKTYGSAETRWEGVGPYYAMFPINFAKDVIGAYTAPGDSTIDPFAGRSTAVFAAASADRAAVGIEINPVGWVYGKAKLATAPQAAVEARLREIVSKAESRTDDDLPEFFRWCYADKVRKFLITAREELNWRRSPADWTLAALLLVYLHGKRESSLSNQMRQSKAMSPGYAIDWWRERRMSPPEVDVTDFMLKRIAWRYAHGRADTSKSTLMLGDSMKLVRRVQHRVNDGVIEPFRLVFTSPPYIGVTNYHYDQWLRLWMLGGRSDARRVGERHRGKFENASRYTHLMKTVFGELSEICARTSTIYVRVDARLLTFDTMHDVLTASFPKHRVTVADAPFERPTQTALFGDKESKPGERDIILRR